MRDSSATYGRIWLAPNAQLMPDAERPRVPDRDVERVERLARQRAAAPVGDRRPRSSAAARRRAPRTRRACRRSPPWRSACRRSSRAAADRTPPSISPRTCSRRRRARWSNVIGAKRRVVDVGRDRQRAVGRADRAGDEARPIGRPRRPLVGGRPGQARAVEVQLVGQRLEAVVGLRDGRAAERVGLDDVGAGLEIGVVDVAR